MPGSDEPLPEDKKPPWRSPRGQPPGDHQGRRRRGGRGMRWSTTNPS
ncbi:hypothetical protein ACPA9J_04450 [Pseudomonas aeruginosa]